MGRLVVTAHTAAVPDDKEWGDYLAQVDAYLPLSGQRILVVSAGGGPNGPQRKGMTDALGGVKVPVAILTSSMMMRGAGIAVSWFNPSLKVFGPDGLDSALDYLELTPWEHTESIRVLNELQAQLGLGVVRSLRSPPSPTRQTR